MLPQKIMKRKWKIKWRLEGYRVGEASGRFQKIPGWATREKDFQKIPKGVMRWGATLILESS